ncbi:M48 family metalloprotease [candidate division KSB1 bacterium]|nr:M48 family metalloprotease [candidate division KSB1 bacterium]
MRRNNKTKSISRRDFLWIASASSAGMLVACAVNPVTGKHQLVLMSEGEEVALDKQHSPHQFSSDFGEVQDPALNKYITDVGLKMTVLSHRPQMPYSFRAVNATYVNAYAFPGGSIATTRGILLELENEAELAALLGHEIGHVNARHTAGRMSKAMLLNAAVGAGAILISSKNETAGLITAGLGSLGSGLLLAKYSRDDERQADALGMDYMTKAGYSPDGMIGLMDVLKSLSSHKPNAIEAMFSSHPMSDERYQTAVQSSNTTHASAKGQKLSKERYMDQTAKLRKLKDAIELMQDGQKEMGQQNFTQAETQLKAALKKAPSDYVGLVLMANCQLAMEKYQAAEGFAEKAKKVYHKEAQGHHLGGIAKLLQKKYSSAYQDFMTYDNLLPGNPNTTFLKGYTQENMEHKLEAASEYKRYLQAVNQGEQADHARGRLIEWGYIEAPAQEQ